MRALGFSYFLMHFQNGKKHCCKRALLATMAQIFGLGVGNLKNRPFLPWGTKHFFKKSGLGPPFASKLFTQNFWRDFDFYFSAKNVLGPPRQNSYRQKSRFFKFPIHQPKSLRHCCKQGTLATMLFTVLKMHQKI